MSGKSKNKGFSYDSQTRMVRASGDMEEQLKSKVTRVLEVFPKVTKDQAIVLLQHFQHDEESTINALMENGAEDILNQWHFRSGPKPTMKTKKKKNKKKKVQVSTVSEETENSSDNNNHNTCDDQLIASQEEEAEPYKCNLEKERTDDCLEETRVFQPKEVESVVDCRGDASTQKSSSSSSPQSEGAKFVSRDSSRRASFSEDTSRHSTPLSSTSSYPAGQGKQSLERSMKDLSRQTVALQRVHNLLEEELDSSFKRIKAAIAEAQKLLEERNHKLEEEMEKVKKDARQLLSQRQELAAELKRRSERISSMTEADLNDLRADIKHFVVERKLDEELGKTLRFMWDKDRITQEVMAFGEIAQVKNCYSQRRQSTSSVASSSNVATPTHEDPLNKEVRESPVDPAKTSVAEETIEQKDNSSRQQGGTRPFYRTFYGLNYHRSPRSNYRYPFYPGGGGGRRRSWGGSPRGGRREDGHWDNQPQHYPKMNPYHERVVGDQTPEGGGTTHQRHWESRPPYRGNRPSYRGRGHGPRHDSFGARGRHPAKDLQMNGEALKPADGSNIANGVVDH